MPDTIDYYDTNLFGERLTKMREARYSLYAQYKDLGVAIPANKEKYKHCENQTTFADSLIVSRQSYNSWENGTMPSLNNILLLCERLDCSIDYLLGGDDRPLGEPYRVAHFYSKIDTTIIEHCRDNPNYRDFLNYIMNPQKCSGLIEAIDLIQWKDYVSKIRIPEIGEKLRFRIIDCYNHYIAIHNISDINISTYKKYFEHSLRIDEADIKESVSEEDFESYKDSSGIFNYAKFINNIAEKSFEPLRNYTNWETQKDIFSKLFRDSLQGYIENFD